MYCKYCGAQLPEEAKFCTACGKEQEETETTPIKIQEPVIDPAANIDAKTRRDMRNSILVWGILSISFATTMFISWLGFIFSFIAKAKAAKYQKMFGVLDWQAKVGNHLAKAGFGVGLGLTIFWFIYLILFFVEIILIQIYAYGMYEIMNSFSLTAWMW